MPTPRTALESLLLPIIPHLDAIGAGVRDNPLSIIQAPPGSGKTTVLPLFLADQPWLHGKKILVLQPRRLAAKAVASRMAELLGESVGESVGYHIRLERKTCQRTRIEVITEGLLTRSIVSDPALSDVGLIIFDEFHERSLHAEVGLGLAREVLGALRDDLRVVVMSATLGSLLDGPEILDAWRYSFDTAPHPVEINYIAPEPRKPIWEETARVVRSALMQHEGDLLAFLPGAYEIERCLERLQDRGSELDLIPLFGELPYEQQRLALEPARFGRRKVILATPIAETSLTIDGVRIVVDSGLHKVSRSETTGISHLKTERISLDSAEQRAGRAGRTAPGTCIRLWSEAEHKTLRASREPEILRSDLTQPFLELAAWGVRDPLQFNWITRPPASACSEALRTLRELRVIDSEGAITERGKTLVALGTHPRIASLCVAARAHGLERYAAALMPLLEERIPQTVTKNTADIGRLVDAVMSDSRSGALSARIFELSKRWLRRMENLTTPALSEKECCPASQAVGFLLATAFPERIAKRRSDSQERYVMSAGQGVFVRHGDPLARNEFLVVATLLRRESDSEASLASALDPQLFESHLAHLVCEERRVEFDEQRGQLRAATVKRCGAVVLHEEPQRELQRDELRAALISYLRTPDGMARLTFSDAAVAFRSRVAWVRSHGLDSIPDLSDEALRSSDPFWLEAAVPHDGRLSGITPQKIEAALRESCTWAQRREIEEVAPESIALPNGKVRQLDYSSGNGPALHATIQELFGFSSTPLVGRFRESVTLHILSPARRPMQVTKDLAGFWRGSYQEIRKELRGRYPKHKWPEDPI